MLSLISLFTVSSVLRTHSRSTSYVRILPNYCPMVKMEDERRASETHDGFTSDYFDSKHEDCEHQMSGMNAKFLALFWWLLYIFFHMKFTVPYSLA